MYFWKVLQIIDILCLGVFNRNICISCKRLSHMSFGISFHYKTRINACVHLIPTNQYSCHSRRERQIALWMWFLHGFLWLNSKGMESFTNVSMVSFRILFYFFSSNLNFFTIQVRNILFGGVIVGARKAESSLLGFAYEPPATRGCTQGSTARDWW